MKIRVLDGTVLIGEARVPGDIVDVTEGVAREVIAMGRAALYVEEEAVDTGGGAGIDDAPQMEAVALAEAEADIAAEAPGVAQAKRGRGRPRRY